MKHVKGWIYPHMLARKISREKGTIRRAKIFTQSIGPRRIRKSIKGKGPRQCLEL
jgi:hypothetical protein